jgi:predicted ATPase
MSEAQQNIFLTRVRLRNYKSIAACDVKLGALTYLVGRNGAGKSNFLSALDFTRNALTTSLDAAANEAGGEIVGRYVDNSKNFIIRLDFKLTGRHLNFKQQSNFDHINYSCEGYYAFEINDLFGLCLVKEEKCKIIYPGEKITHFHIEEGKWRATSEDYLPLMTKDQLALRSLSGFESFSPLFKALSSMSFYNINPKSVAKLQRPSQGRDLKHSGENIASVIRHLERTAPEKIAIITDYLQKVVPSIREIKLKTFDTRETLEFYQEVGLTKDPWRFSAENMSDGTLRALGILTALFQGNPDYRPLLVGIEEPETALHPAATHALCEALQQASEQTQVIVTTHSPDLLDSETIDADTILAVNINRGETKIAHIDATSKDMLKRHLFSAGELLRQDQLEPDPEELSQSQPNKIDLFGDVAS